MIRRAGQVRRLVVMAGAVLAGVGCSERADVLGVRLEDVDGHRARWASTRPVDYTFTLVRQCECTEEMAGPVTMTVSADAIVAMTYRDGSPVPLASYRHFPTVDRIFEVIRESVLSGYAVTLIFDDASGVPLWTFVEPDPDVGDDEFGYRVLALPTPATTQGEGFRLRSPGSTGVVPRPTGDTP